MSSEVLSRKKAQKLLHDTGKKFVSEHVSTNTNSVILRSKEPSICWKAGGKIGFYAISEYCGPNTTGPQDPLLFRLRVNLNPPPAIPYHLKSPAVQHKLQIKNVIMASSPIMQLTAMPEEIEQLSAWFMQWLEGHFSNSPLPPPPVRLVQWGWDINGKDKKVDFTALGANWKDCNYLWSIKAIEAFEPLLQTY